MFIIYIYLMLVCLNVYTDSKILRVVDSGVIKFEKDDMMLVFFVTVQHTGKKPRRVMVTTNECCEDVSESDRDCDIISLHGGDFGFIQPGAIRNFTLIYPNLYGYNRKGRCLVSILHRAPGIREVVEIYHRIDFDTRIKEKEIPELEEIYELKNIDLCETPDLDPLNHCNPVDCNVKYSGYRSYFNRKVKLCQKTKVCHTNLKKELPDVVYVPTINDCRDLEKAFGKEDFNAVVNHKYRAEPMVNVRCHHGVINPKTGFCDCDYGWKSEPYDPDVSTYSMCTIECPREKPFDYLLFLLGVGLAVWLISFVYFCERYDVFLIKKGISAYSEEEMFCYSMHDTEKHGSDKSSTTLS